MKFIGVLSIVLLCLHSCGQKKTDDYTPKNSPELEEIFEKARKTNNLRSLLVSRNGELIAEEYFDRFPSDSLEHVRSVTKSVMATLIGIAIGKGIIGGVDDSIVKYLGKDAKGKEGVTIKHLMAMTSGIAWREVMGDMEIDEWINSKSPLKYVLDKPIENPPGTSWEYSTGIIHLLSVILSEASGMSTLEFANKHLFQPLGIEKVKWQLLNDGHYHGGSRLQLKPRDMIKFGLLYLNGGMFDGKRIVSKAFIKDATSQQEPEGFFGSQEGYGYGWWVGGDENVRGFMAQGYGGQTILVVPDHEIVIATTYKWKVSNQMAADQQQEALNVVGAGVLKALLNF